MLKYSVFKQVDRLSVTLLLTILPYFSADCDSEIGIKIKHSLVSYIENFNFFNWTPAV